MIFHASRSVGIICECGAIIQGKCTPEESQLSCDPMESIANIFSILNNNSKYLHCLDRVWCCSCLCPVSQCCSVASFPWQRHDTHRTNMKEIERHRASNRHHRNMLRHSGKEVLLGLPPKQSCQVSCIIRKGKHRFRFKLLLWFKRINLGRDLQFTCKEFDCALDISKGGFLSSFKSHWFGQNPQCDTEWCICNLYVYNWL